MDSFSGRTWYDILAVEPSCGPAELKAAYKQKLLDNHPDKSSSYKTEINSIQMAYKVLSDPEQRQEYDEDLKKKVQLQGFNITGDGLDIYNLSDFTDLDAEWVLNCPRCESINSMKLTEDDLVNFGTDDGQGGYEIVTQCGDCSLWIKVQYYEEEQD